MCQRRGNHVLKGTTIKGNNMLTNLSILGGIFLHLKTIPIKIDNDFKLKGEKPSK